jgi:hypothetical protein
MPVVLFSLAAALAFAVAAVLQQHAAAGEPAVHNLRPRLVLRLARRPLWLIGVASSGVGTLLQLLALAQGSLVMVQPLLVCGLLFALPINAFWLHRRRPHLVELAATSAVCAGLALYLVAADPRAGRGSAAAGSWGIALASILVAVIVLLTCSIYSKGALSSGLLAGAAGVVNGLSAAFVKGVAREMRARFGTGLAADVVHTLGNWELYAFAATLLAAVLLVQSAFQRGPIRWSLPALTAFNPLTSVLLGSTLLGERVQSTPLAMAGAAIGLTVVLGGILTLSSSTLITGGPPGAALAAGGASGMAGGAQVVPGPPVGHPLTGAQPTPSYDGPREGLDPGRLRQPGTAVSRPPD